jgi:hypothetical protein
MVACRDVGDAAVPGPQDIHVALEELSLVAAGN